MAALSLEGPVAAASVVARLGAAASEPGAAVAESLVDAVAQLVDAVAQLGAAASEPGVAVAESLVDSVAPDAVVS